MGTEPAPLDQALQGLNVKECKPCLTVRLASLRCSAPIEDLHQDEPVIPCTEVLKEKCGPTSEIKSY